MAAPLADPLRFSKIADDYLVAVSHKDDDPTVLFWRGDFWRWETGKWWRTAFSSMKTRVHRWMMESEIQSDVDVAVKVTHCVSAKCAVMLDDRPQPFWWPPVISKLGSTWLHMLHVTVDPERLARGDADWKRPKTSRWFSEMSLDFDPDPYATCPTWIDLLDRQIPDPQARLLLQEFFGYWLVPDTSLHAALFLIGEAGCGKSTITEVALNLLGPDNCGYFKLKDFGAHFGKDSLDGKYLTICDEAESRISPEAETGLKQFISGARDSVDRKNESRIVSKPLARVVACTNKWPEFRDNTDGIWRRIHCIRMGKPIPYDERSPKILGVLRGETSGIFNWAIEGLKRLRQQERFTVPPSSVKEISSVKSSLQSHKEFVKANVGKGDGTFVPNAVILSEYQRWCSENGVKRDRDIRDISMEIIHSVPGSEVGRGRWQGKTVRGVSGIVIQPQDVKEHNHA